jgi:hypothetical protein
MLGRVRVRARAEGGAAFPRLFWAFSPVGSAAGHVNSPTSRRARDGTDQPISPPPPPAAHALRGGRHPARPPRADGRRLFPRSTAPSPPTLSRACPTSPRVVPLSRVSAVPVLPLAMRFARDKAQEPFIKQRASTGGPVRCGA